MKHYTLEELRVAVQTLPFFGETLFEIHKKVNGEMNICILDEEQERYVNELGDITEGEYRKVTKMATIRTDTNGVIVAIEEPYEKVLSNNVEYVALLLSLVGKTVSIK